MKPFFRSSTIASAIAALAMLQACSPIQVAPNVALLQAHRTESTSRLVYAFSPNVPLMAVYKDATSGTAKPISALQGPNTQLATGNGMAVDSDGTIYFVVYDGTSSGSSIKLLAFAPNSYGDVAPERVAVLKGPLLAGYAVGLALDGRGNFWVSAIGK